MMVKLIRNDLGAPPHLRDDPRVHRPGLHSLYYRNGALVEVSARGAYLLVGNGDAEPADAEAEVVCSGWKDKRQEVLLSRAMLAAGIDPEDRERFRNKEILGYDVDGNDIPGPNYVTPDPDEEDDDDVSES